MEDVAGSGWRMLPAREPDDRRTDPGLSAPVVNLADYGMVNFTGAAVTSVNGTHGTLSANSL
jgi:hypothetical protein